MKRQSLFISIPEPCNEKWSEMTIKEKGRHCAPCKKTVIDFTRMTKSYHSAEAPQRTTQYDGSMLISGTYVISLIADEKLIASEVFIKI